MTDSQTTKIKMIKGRGLPLPGNDIDTDRIMPARFLKCVTFTNLGHHCFQDERVNSFGKPTEHPFNHHRYKGAEILIVNKNFGCGSSREHAPQGLRRWGFRAIIGESFAEIFAGNGAGIGLVLVTVSETDVARLMGAVRANPDLEITIDLKKKTATFGTTVIPLGLKESVRKNFLDGAWDAISVLRSAGDRIHRTAEKIPYLHWRKAGFP